MNYEKIKSITCGILYKKSFGVMDKWGKIVDEILHKKPYFSTDYFPSIDTNYNAQCKLHNKEQGHYLILSSSTLIYQHTIMSDFENEYKTFCESLSKFLVPDIIYKNNLCVMRLGFVYSYELDDEEMKKYMNYYFNSGIKGISDFRISKKEPTLKGGTISGNSDYINKIITVGAVAEKYTGLTYDYQHYINRPSCRQ